MIFDKFCAIVERHYPELEALAREAKVFLFDKPAHAIKPGDTQPENFDMFTLPFPCTVMEDTATAVLIIDSEENQVGMLGARTFVDIVPVHSDGSAFANQDLELTEQERFQMRQDMLSQGWDDSTVMLSFGEISDGTPEAVGITFVGGTSRIIIASKNKVFLDEHVGYFGEIAMHQTAIGPKNTIAAIEELISIYTKKHFVLETQPVNPKLHPRKIPRVHQRPTYTILDARTIRHKMGTLDSHERALEEGRQRNSPIPHERRRHPRRLSAAGGHYKEDKVIIIPACWIGQSEARVGNKIYKVRLDI